MDERAVVVANLSAAVITLIIQIVALIISFVIMYFLGRAIVRDGLRIFGEKLDEERKAGRQYAGLLGRVLTKADAA